MEPSSQWHSDNTEQALTKAKKPMIVVGSGSLQRDDGASIHAAVSSLSQKLRVKNNLPEDWKVLNVLHRVSIHLIFCFIFFW